MGMLGSAGNLIASFLGAGLINEALGEAISEMESMCANEGQSSALSNIIPEFEANADADVNDGWTDVSCSPYCDFIGEIVEAGNSIMGHAYAVAQGLSGGGGDGEEYDEDSGEPVEE